MNLTIKDRILIPEILPESGDMVEMILVRSIQKKVEITAKDIDYYEIKTNESGNTQWNGSKDKGVDIEFENSEIEILKRSFQKLNDEKKINNRNFDLCLKLKEL